jgi:hypothetical protein
MAQYRASSSMDLEKHITPDEVEQSQASSSAELNTQSPNTKHELDTLSRIESATSTVFDPASRVPTNISSRESGIIGNSPHTHHP